MNIVMKYLKKLNRVKGFLAGVALTATAFLFIRARTANDPYFEISKNLDIYTNLFKELNTYYVDPIEPGKLVKTGVDAMLDDLDPYTNYITESDVEDYEFMTTGKYGGIGANMHRKGDEIFIGDVYENSPAQKAGLHPGDMVISIDDQPVKGKSIEDMSLLLKGAPGTQISMKVKDAFSGAENKKIVMRGEIEISSVPYAGLIGTQKNIAYVKLTQFTQGCARQVRDAFDSLQKVQPALKGLVLDLRNNPGGVLNAAVTVSDAFLDEGLVVYTDGRIEDSKMKFNATPGDLLEGAPIVVLINAGSASASEIVAGALQDHNRAVIMGEKTFGKGSVQTILPTSNGAAVKLTTARYYTPSGRSIQAEGISPDVLISKVKIETANQSEFGPIKEADLANHLENNRPSPKREPIKELTAPKDGPKDGTKGPIDSEDALAVQDYPLNEALNLLRGINIVKKTPKTTPAKP